MLRAQVTSGVRVSNYQVKMRLRRDKVKGARLSEVIWVSFTVAVFITSLTIFLFVPFEGRRLGMQHLWVYILCTLAVGGSLGLPLFLLFRERKLKK